MNHVLSLNTLTIFFKVLIKRTTFYLLCLKKKVVHTPNISFQCFWFHHFQLHCLHHYHCFSKITHFKYLNAIFLILVIHKKINTIWNVDVIQENHVVISFIILIYYINRVCIFIMNIEKNFI